MRTTPCVVVFSLSTRHRMMTVVKYVITQNGFTASTHARVDATCEKVVGEDDWSHFEYCGMAHMVKIRTNLHVLNKTY